VDLASGVGKVEYELQTLNDMIKKTELHGETTELASMEATSMYSSDVPVKIDDSRTDLSKLLGVAWDKQLYV